MRAWTAVILATAACQPQSQAFRCAQDEQCKTGTRDGFCEQAGLCSFADDQCPSGKRYGELSDTLAGVCVAPGNGDETPTPALTTTGWTSFEPASTSGHASTTATGNDTMATATTGEISVESSSSSTGGLGCVEFVDPFNTLDSAWFVSEETELEVAGGTATVSFDVSGQAYINRGAFELAGGYIGIELAEPIPSEVQFFLNLIDENTEQIVDWGYSPNYGLAAHATGESVFEGLDPLGGVFGLRYRVLEDGSILLEYKRSNGEWETATELTGTLGAQPVTVVLFAGPVTDATFMGTTSVSLDAFSVCYPS